MAAKTKKTETKFPPRVRFNWGFWDAAADIRRGNLQRRLPSPQWSTQQFPLPAFDKVYCAGYTIAWEAYQEALKAGTVKDSDEAWKAYKAK
jgi:hypothetical protein